MLCIFQTTAFATVTTGLLYLGLLHENGVFFQNPVAPMAPTVMGIGFIKMAKDRLERQTS